MTDQVFINMDPETEYYAYCYGVTAENTLATPITKSENHYRCSCTCK